MDITQARVAETVKIELKDGNGDSFTPEKLYVEIYGMGSTITRNALNEYIKRDDKLKKRDATPEDFSNSRARYLAECTVNWHGVTHPDADPSNARDTSLAIYGDPRLGFIATQISNAILDWGKFTTKVNTN